MPDTLNRAVPAAEGATAPSPVHGRRGTLPTWLKGITPLMLLAVLVAVFLRFGPLGVFEAAFPPIEELTVQRVTMPAPGEMRVYVVNGGPEPVTLAQVSVDDATWTHTIDGDRTIGRLERRVVTIPYPWVAGEPHVISLITSTGLTFRAEVAVAAQTPQADTRYLTTFAMLGVYVGVIPVFLGLLWLPFLRSINRRWLDFFLSLTIGLLVFLGVDAIGEALATAGRVPGAFQGTSLVLIGLLGTPLVITAIGHARKKSRTALSVAALIALAIGLHNLGEGLAIGAAYASGEIALGTFLVLGFLLHNTTEGLGIVTPLADEKPSIRDLILLGLLAGAPTILGAWIGGFSASPTWTTVFFAIGAGAIIQVVYELWKLFHRRPDTSLAAPLNAAGVLIGLLIMYGTGLFVTA